MKTSRPSPPARSTTPLARFARSLPCRRASALALTATLAVLWLATVPLGAAPEPTAPSGERPPFSAKEIAQGYREGVVLAKPRADQRPRSDADETREGHRVRRRWERFGDLREIELNLAPDESTLAAAARLRATGRYEYVQPDTIRAATVTPNDPEFPKQWAHANDGGNNGIAGADIKSAAAWDVRTDASAVVVAVIDSGIRYNHPDLAANMWVNPREIPGNGIDDDGNGYVDDVHGINAILNNGNPADDLGHGTHVAGIIGAVGNNGTGVAGVAWQVKLMALKFLRGGTGTTAGRGSTSDGIECINYAIRHGAHIINGSYGAASGPVTQFDPAERDAILAARAAGILFVAAAGNDAANMELLAHYPASYRLENVVAVANSTARDDASISTNFGAGSVELFAPGTEIWSTWHTDALPYRHTSGTSMAAPHVAGALALLKAHFPADTYRRLVNRLLRHVDPVSAFSGRVQTGGRLNLDRALRSADIRPFNDDFAARSRLAGSNFSIRNVNTDATVEPGEPAVAGQAGGASLWWEWTPTQTAVVRLSTAGSSYDTLLGVYTGSSLATLVPVAASDDDGGAVTSRLEFTAQAGTTYQIAVAGKGAGHGLTLLDLGAIPPNDNFAAAQVIAGRSALIDAVNAQTTLETGEPRILGIAGGKSLWYRWTAPSSGRYQFAAKSEGFDPLLAVYTGPSLTALSVVGANDNFDPAAGGAEVSTTAIVSVDAFAGMTYHVQVAGRATGTTPPANAPFTLTLNDSLWQGLAGSSITCAPVVGPDGAVYVGSTDGYFHAFNADGSRRWPAVNLGERAQDTSAAVLAPDGTLYFGTSASTLGNDGKVLAYDSATGQRKWEFVIPNAAAGASANNAVALGADGTLYVFCAAATASSSRLVALTDQGTRAVQRWVAAVPGPSYASPVVAPDGTVYLGSDDAAGGHRFYAFDGATGAVKWSAPTDNAVYTAAALDAAGNLYYGTLTSGRLYSRTPAGALRWTYTGGSVGTSSSPALSPDGRTVYFGGYDSKLHAVDSATGAGRWTFPLGKEVRASSPAVDSNGVVYIGSYDGLLYGVNPDGTLKRTWSTGSIVRSSPAISGTTLYVGSNDFHVYAFDIGAGTGGPWSQYRHNPRRTGRAVAEPPGIAASPRAESVVAGAAVQLSVVATGTGPLAYQWLKDGVPVPGATDAVFVLRSAVPADTANYTARVVSPIGVIDSAPAAVAVRAAGETEQPPRLANLSVRTAAGTGSRTLIVGFFVTGSPDKTLLVRAIGPSLEAFGVAGALADPRLDLYSGAAALAGNDDWATPVAPVTTTAAALAAAFGGAGAFPLAPTSRDAALLRSLGNGGYTVQITGATGTGVALAEVYDTAPAAGARLANVSARTLVGSGADVLIAGFAVTGNVPKTVLIRAAGPSLGSLGVSGTLADPVLALYRGTVRLDENDNWAVSRTGTTSAALGAAFLKVGAFAFGGVASRDAALLVTLVPGSYTAQVSGADGATGVALVEVYEVP